MSKKRNLYFLNARGKKILVAEQVPLKGIEKIIKDYVHGLNPDYKIYYYRSWERDSSLGKPAVVFDIDSHFEFFIWEEE